MKKVNIIVILRKPITIISDSLFGEKHTLTHRVVVGVVMMACGVQIASLTSVVHIEIFRLGLDGVGYLIHGIGSVPLVDLIKKIAGSNEN